MLQIWNGKIYRYYDDDELAYASTLLTPVGNADKCGMKPVSVISGIRQKISIFPPQS